MGPKPATDVSMEMKVPVGLLLVDDPMLEPTTLLFSCAPPSEPRMKVKLAAPALAASEKLILHSADQRARPDTSAACSVAVQLEAASKK